MPIQTAIIGAGSAGQSLLALLRQMGQTSEQMCFFEEDHYYQQRQQLDVVAGLPLYPLSQFDPERWQVFIALGTPSDRARIASQLPPETVYPSCIHPQAFLLTPYDFPAGTVIYPFVYLSRDVQLGQQVVLMTATVVGHNVSIGDFATFSGNVGIGGNSQIGKRVFCGLNSAIRHEVSLCDDITLGMGAMATRSLKEPGVYIGNPARLLKK